MVLNALPALDCKCLSKGRPQGCQARILNDLGGKPHWSMKGALASRYMARFGSASSPGESGISTRMVSPTGLTRLFFEARLRESPCCSLRASKPRRRHRTALSQLHDVPVAHLRALHPSAFRAVGAPLATVWRTRGGGRVHASGRCSGGLLLRTDTNARRITSLSKSPCSSILRVTLSMAVAIAGDGCLASTSAKHHGGAPQAGARFLMKSPMLTQPCSDELREGTVERHASRRPARREEVTHVGGRNHSTSSSSCHQRGAALSQLDP